MGLPRVVAAVICAALFAVGAMAQGELYEGSPCVGSGGAPGACAVLQRCESALRDLREGRRPRLCAFDGFTPIVCCTDLSATTTTTTTTTTASPAPATQRPTQRPATDSAPTPEPVAGYNGTISMQKCNEWGSKVYKLQRPEVATTLFAKPVNTSLCTLEKGVPFIIGGRDASPNEFPHMAAIGFGEENRMRWLCGGALISERFVLTAAHCIDDPGSYNRRGAGPAKWVRLGEHNIASAADDSKVQVIPVEQRIPYPGYTHNIKYHDIGLLRLSRDAVIGREVRPACLHTIATPIPTQATAIGWGNTDVYGSPAAILQKINLPMVEQEKCRPHFDPNTFPAYRPSLGQGLVDTMVCAGGDRFGGKDTCQGDSGGPLQMLNRDPYCTYTIIGLTSFGKSCAQPNTPAVYSRVSSYIPWIESHVWP